MLYENIKKICDKKKKSISQLERELDFARSSICKWNENLPSIAKVQAVAKALGVPIEELLE